MVIPPLTTIQVQNANTCESYGIPYLNLSEVNSSAEIGAKLEEIDPKVVICSIEAISDPSVQAQLQSLAVSYIALDECQVAISKQLSEKKIII